MPAAGCGPLMFPLPLKPAALHMHTRLRPWPLPSMQGAARPMFPFEDAWEHVAHDEYGASLDYADFDPAEAIGEAAGFLYSGSVVRKPSASLHVFFNVLYSGLVVRKPSVSLRVSFTLVWLQAVCRANLGGWQTRPVGFKRFKRIAASGGLLF